MKRALENLYKFLPYPFQNLACSLRSIEQRKIRFGGIFWEKLQWLESTQWWDEAQIKSYQINELKRILRHALSEIPYYGRIFANNGISLNDINSLSDLRLIPPLDKEALIMNSEELIAKNANTKMLVHSATGGTTGKSVSFFLEEEAIQFRWAVWWRHRKRFGINFNSSYATFTGLAAVPVDCLKPPFWRENRLLKQTIFSMHHLTPNKIRFIVDRLNSGGFEYYSGYPSILFHMANLIEEGKFSINCPPKMIFTGAETLTGQQKDKIENILRAPVSDLYGFSEGAGNASKCEYGVYHEDFEFGILECHNPEQLGQSLIRGEILATGFASKAMPLIRYKVGDIGIWEEKACICGRKSKVLVGIEGRLEDYVLLPEGGRIRRFDYIFKSSINIQEAQVIQKKLGEITVKIVKRSHFSDSDEKSMRSEIASKISRNLSVIFEYVDEIEREPNGKFRAVKSLLNL